MPINVGNCVIIGRRPDASRVVHPCNLVRAVRSRVRSILSTLTGFVTARSRTQEGALFRRTDAHGGRVAAPADRCTCLHVFAARAGGSLRPSPQLHVPCRLSSPARVAATTSTGSTEWSASTSRGMRRRRRPSRASSCAYATRAGSRARSSGHIEGSTVRAPG
jgi:hypothetical protein